MIITPETAHLLLVFQRLPAAVRNKFRRRLPVYDAKDGRYQALFDLWKRHRFGRDRGIDVSGWWGEFLPDQALTAATWGRQHHKMGERLHRFLAREELEHDTPLEEKLLRNALRRYELHEDYTHQLTDRHEPPAAADPAAEGLRYTFLRERNDNHNGRPPMGYAQRVEQLIETADVLYARERLLLELHRSNSRRITADGNRTTSEYDRLEVSDRLQAADSLGILPILVDLRDLRTKHDHALFLRIHRQLPNFLECADWRTAAIVVPLLFNHIHRQLSAIDRDYLRYVNELGKLIMRHRLAEQFGRLRGTMFANVLSMSLIANDFEYALHLLDHELKRIGASERAAIGTFSWAQYHYYTGNFSKALELIERRKADAGNEVLFQSRLRSLELRILCDLGRSDDRHRDEFLDCLDRFVRWIQKEREGQDLPPSMKIRYLNFAHCLRQLDALFRDSPLQSQTRTAFVQEVQQRAPDAAQWFYRMVREKGTTAAR